MCHERRQRCVLCCPVSTQCRVLADSVTPPKVFVTTYPTASLCRSAASAGAAIGRAVLGGSSVGATVAECDDLFASTVVSTADGLVELRES